MSSTLIARLCPDVGAARRSVGRRTGGTAARRAGTEGLHGLPALPGRNRCSGARDDEIVGIFDHGGQVGLGRAAELGAVATLVVVGDDVLRPLAARRAHGLDAVEGQPDRRVGTGVGDVIAPLFDQRDALWKLIFVIF